MTTEAAIIRVDARLRPPYPRPKPRRKRELGEKPVTIIAGFKCVDGLVLCADSELTMGKSFKSYGAKIARSHEEAYRLTSAVAGHVDYAESLWESILRHIDQSDKSFESIRQIIETDLTNFYHDHVYPSPYDDIDFQLLMGLWTKDRPEYQLFKNASSALLEGMNYEIAGVGAPLGNYLAHTLMRKREITVDEGEIIAVQIIKQAKRFVPYCGGDTIIWVLHSDGRSETPNPPRIEAIEEYLDEVEKLVGENVFQGIPEFLSILEEKTKAKEKKR